MARPKKTQDEARTERLNLRLTAAERALISEVADHHGLPVTEYVRTTILRPRHPIPPPPDRKKTDPGLVLAINRVGVNLNQIARAFNRNSGFVPDELDTALRRVNEYLDQVQEIGDGPQNR